jgi:hypothetical protein
MASKISLKVNGNQLELNPFVENYVYQITSGMVASLKDTAAINKLLLEVTASGDVKMTLNGKAMDINFFVTEIIRSTLAGMVSTLKGAEGKLKTLELKIG